MAARERMSQAARNVAAPRPRHGLEHWIAGMPWGRSGQERASPAAPCAAGLCGASPRRVGLPSLRGRRCVLVTGDQNPGGAALFEKRRDPAPVAPLGLTSGARRRASVPMLRGSAGSEPQLPRRDLYPPYRCWYPNRCAHLAGQRHHLNDRAHCSSGQRGWGSRSHADQREERGTDHRRAHGCAVLAS